MIKFFIILIVGTIETIFFTKWSLKANKQKAISSSIMMMLYMSIYLLILNTIFTDSHSKVLIIAYVLACGIGNYLAVQNEKKSKRNKKR
jgi:uncharacterized protein YebE (UPF0316 family)